MSCLPAPLSRFFQSSIGKKILVALTGLILAGFLLGHLIGNLLVFAGPEAINEYGHFLQTAGHGMLVWVARITLLTAVVVHIVCTVQLTRENRAARPGAYAADGTNSATRSSRIMIWSGLTILAFVIYHLMHFTLRTGNDYASYTTLVDGHPAHDVFRMVIAGFSWAPASIFYLIAMALLCSHLSHGVSSMFQTLGLVTNRNWPFFRFVGYAYAALIFFGNAAIVLSIWIFGYGR
ncbi:MAG: succinate dehydrogenase cytochrome b subunit [Verrucomicrobiales bacterium]|nr:succinate dehydrogenase cytochrome b subunit [Verrucomicrobiales bacterium]